MGISLHLLISRLQHRQAADGWTLHHRCMLPVGGMANRPQEPNRNHTRMSPRPRRLDATNLFPVATAASIAKRAGV